MDDLAPTGEAKRAGEAKRGGRQAFAEPRDLEPPADAPPPPFVHRCRVGWADCDVAQIAYTGRLPAFALDAIDAFWGATVGADWYRLNLDYGIGTPFVHLEMDFHSPVTPRAPLDCRVEVSRLGRSSIGFRVLGLQGDRHCFTGNFVSAFVEAASFAKLEIPPAIRAAAEAHLKG